MYFLRTLAVASLLCGNEVLSQPLFNKKSYKRDQLSDINSIISDAQSSPQTSTDYSSAIQGVFGDLFNMGYMGDEPDKVAEGLASLGGMFESMLPLHQFENPQEVQEYFQEMQDPQSYQTFFENVADTILNGFAPSSIVSSIEGFDRDVNDINNYNPRNPNSSVYPIAQVGDAPYSLSEEDLRAAIEIPPDFEYGTGKKNIVIFVPATGTRSGMVYYSNFLKLFREKNFADSVWLNIPDYMLDDAQVNAEFVAYAINYVSGISQGAKVNVISFSQGGLSTQWALTFWPSTRTKTRNFIPLSADFHGSKEFGIFEPIYDVFGFPPAYLQQDYDSEFVKALRTHSGDSAWVPTTSIYSGFDQIVQPQNDEDASAYLLDYHGAGVLNAELQKICPGRPAGLFYTHEGVLYNPVAYALAVDAIVNGGPAQPARIDLDTLCYQVVTEGLTMDDVFATEALGPEVVVRTLTYKPYTKTEPVIKPYAL